MTLNNHRPAILCHSPVLYHTRKIHGDAEIVPICREGRKLSVLGILLVVVVSILLLNVKTGVYRNQARLINFDGIGKRNQWHLVARWRP